MRHFMLFRESLSHRRRPENKFQEVNASFSNGTQRSAAASELSQESMASKSAPRSLTRRNVCRDLQHNDLR